MVNELIEQIDEIGKKRIEKIVVPGEHMAELFMFGTSVIKVGPPWPSTFDGVPFFFGDTTQGKYEIHLI